MALTEEERAKVDEARQTLKDICGAAENDEPYTCKELVGDGDGFALAAYNGLCEVLGIEEE